VYQRLGLTVGSVVKGTPLQQRRAEYSKDITYVENSELGFDYLRDNLVQTMDKRNVVWRPLNFAIVDEIDSILVDEARTPLIISEAREEATEKYTYYANIVNLLSPCSTKKKVSKGLLNELMHEGIKDQEEDGYYYIDEKTKTAALSGKGIAKLEEILRVENIYKDMGFEEIHHIENALRAKAVYLRDIDYIVSNGEVLIVDEHTGRTMPGRRFSEGLHQAIEAKEQVQIQRESQTMATITYQNFFKQYQKLAGMTGTAATEAEEFNKIYELEVVIVPTNKEIIRVDKNDKVYFDQGAKRKFVKEHIKFYHEIGQPMLIGTADIATSEYVSRILEKDAIPHYVLNAKFHEQEAHIVANAGKYQSVVVATNMAGRGTDIKLENGLNETLAQNYAKRVKKLVEKGETSLQATVYSQIEYTLTLQGLKEIFSWSDEQMTMVTGTGLVCSEM
jgi:preprotein translocase subunit SecA